MLHFYSTHNSLRSFAPDALGKAIELNQILGAHYVVLAHPGSVSRIDGWNRIAVGTYPFTITGVSSGVTRRATATLQVGDFGVSITPSVQTAPSTGSATYTNRRHLLERIHGDSSNWNLGSSRRR